MPKNQITGPLLHHLTEELPLAMEIEGRTAGISDWTNSVAERIRLCPDRMCNVRICPRCAEIDAKVRIAEYQRKLAAHKIPRGYAWGHFILSPAWAGANNISSTLYAQTIEDIGAGLLYLRENHWTERRIAGVWRLELSPEGFAHGHLLVCAPRATRFDAAQEGIRTWSGGRMLLLVDRNPIDPEDLPAAVEYVFKGPVPTLRGTWLNPAIAARFLVGARNKHLVRPFGFQRAISRKSNIRSPKINFSGTRANIETARFVDSDFPKLRPAANPGSHSHPVASEKICSPATPSRTNPLVTRRRYSRRRPNLRSADRSEPSGRSDSRSGSRCRWSARRARSRCRPAPVESALVDVDR